MSTPTVHIATVSYRTLCGLKPSFWQPIHSVMPSAYLTIKAESPSFPICSHCEHIFRK